VIAVLVGKTRARLVNPVAAMFLLLVFAVEAVADAPGLAAGVDRVRFGCDAGRRPSWRGLVGWMSDPRASSIATDITSG
jgi:hypothetical protein